MTVTVPPGVSTIGNPFYIGSNTVDQLLAGVPEGTQLYKFDPTGTRWEANLFQFGAWAHPEQTLAPGEGAFIRNLTNAFSVTFEGAPPTNFVVPIHPGFNLVSVPKTGTNNLRPMDRDYIDKVDSARQQYADRIEYIEGADWVSSTGQVATPVRAGEAFIYHRGPENDPWPPGFGCAVLLNNYGPGSGFHAPITSTWGCLWDNWYAQLYGSCCDPGTCCADWASVLTPLGDPIPIPPSSGDAFIDPHYDMVRIMTNNFFRYFKIHVWDASGPDVPFSEFDGWSETFRIPDLDVHCWFWPPGMPQGLSFRPVGPMSTFYVYGPPDPGTNTVFEGQPVQFLSWGLPGFSFQWQKQTPSNTWENVPGDRWTTVPAGLKVTFSIPSVRKSDAGFYRAVSSYKCASGATFAGLLNVLDRPSLKPLIAVGGGTLTLSGSGPAGYSYEIEISEDLIHWRDFAPVANAPSTWQVSIANTPQPARRYYRLRVLP